MTYSFQASGIHSSWLDWLTPEFEQDYFLRLQDFLDQQYHDLTVYPPRELVFNSLIHSPLDRVRVVILGQDPYHRADQAHGFSFSVPRGQPIPPSLRNIFKEVSSDIVGIDPSSKEFNYPDCGNLIPWADQGVLLLNVVLTVRESEPDSHKNKGWEQLTDRIITLISEQKENLVFLLWGNKARAKASLIDDSRHLILEAAHPSPLATGFPGCRHFSQANQYLDAHGLNIIDWYDSLRP